MNPVDLLNEVCLNLKSMFPNAKSRYQPIDGYGYYISLNGLDLFDYPSSDDNNDEADDNVSYSNEFCEIHLLEPGDRYWNGDHLQMDTIALEYGLLFVNPNSPTRFLVWLADPDCFKKLDQFLKEEPSSIRYNLEYDF